MKRLLLLLLLPLFCAWPSINLGGGTPVQAGGSCGTGTPTLRASSQAKVQQNNASPYYYVDVTSGTITAGDLIVLTCSINDYYENMVAITPSDNRGNTYTAVTTQFFNDPGNYTLGQGIFLAVAGATQTVTARCHSGTNTGYLYLLATVSAFSGTDGKTLATYTNGSGTTETTRPGGNLVTGDACTSLYLSVATANSNNTHTGPAGWTMNAAVCQNGTWQTGCLGYYIGTGTQAQTWTGDSPVGSWFVNGAVVEAAP